MSPAAADFEATFHATEAGEVRVACSCGDVIAETGQPTLQQALNAVAEHNMKHQTRTSI